VAIVNARCIHESFRIYEIATHFHGMLFQPGRDLRTYQADLAGMQTKRLKLEPHLSVVARLQFEMPLAPADQGKQCCSKNLCPS
jgi:hypothetical protein